MEHLQRAIKYWMIEEVSISFIKYDLNCYVIKLDISLKAEKNLFCVEIEKLTIK